MFETLSALAYTQFLGKPLIMYGGISTFTLLFLTILFGILVKKGKLKKHGFLLHQIFATLTFIAAAFHGLLGLSSFL
jgi:hypothetical protein